jgi:type IV pilus assembly protein PilN
MKIAVNLASRPYIDLRPIYSRLRTWAVILALVGGALWYLYRNESDEARAARAQVTTVESRVRELEQQQQKYRQMMQQPKDAGILQQSEFLNSLFQRKAFSWTATMTDLETVLPNGVQVLSIDPIVAQDGHVIIRLRVTGERDRALELVRNLEKSRHFAAPRLASESLATAQTNPGMQNVSTNSQVNFDILADYRPLLLATGSEEKPADAASETPAVTHKKKSNEARAQKKPSAVTGGKQTP